MMQHKGKRTELRKKKKKNRASLCAPINSNNKKKKKKKNPRAFDHPFVRHGPTISVLNLLIQLLSFFGPIDAQPKSAGKPDIFFFLFKRKMLVKPKRSQGARC
jgi:hypothetical protein